MKVYMIRHGQSECNRQSLVSGWSQTPLSELGRRQAVERAGRILQNTKFDRIYCSDLRRTQETAHEALPGQTLVLTDKIREAGVGSLTDRPAVDCKAQYGEEFLQSCRIRDFSAYGGESQEDMKRRVQAFIHELEELEGMEN